MGEESDSGEDSEEEEERKSNGGAGAAGAKTASKQPQEESLRRGLVKDVDYTLFPSSVFRHIYSWYALQLPPTLQCVPCVRALMCMCQVWVFAGCWTQGDHCGHIPEASGMPLMT